MASITRLLRGSSNEWFQRDPAGLFDASIAVLQRSKELGVLSGEASSSEEEFFVSLTAALEQYQMQAAGSSATAEKAAANNVPGRLLDLITHTKNVGVLTQCLRLLGTFARAPACREHVSALLRQEGGRKFRDAFGVIRSTMGQSRQVAQSAVALVRSISQSYTGCESILEEAGVAMLCRCTKFWRDDSLAAEACSAMAQLVASGIPKVKETMGEEGGVTLLYEMLQNGGTDVLAVACTALAGCLEIGVNLDHYGGTTKVVARLVEVFTSKNMGSQEQVGALRLVEALYKNPAARNTAKKAHLLKKATSARLSKVACSKLCRVMLELGEADMPPHHTMSIYGNNCLITSILLPR